MAKAYDFWDSFDREHFHPDGTLQKHYREWLMARGKTLDDTLAMEATTIAEVKAFEEREENFLQRFGIPYSEWAGLGKPSESERQRQVKQQAALKEGADLSELPYDMEPDEYYDYHANYPG